MRNEQVIQSISSFGYELELSIKELDRQNGRNPQDFHNMLRNLAQINQKAMIIERLSRKLQDKLIDGENSETL